MIENKNKIEIINSILSNAYAFMKDGDFTEAAKSLEDGLSHDFENCEIISALKCANYWYDKQARLNEISGNYEKGDFLLKNLKYFCSFLIKIKDTNEACVYSIKQWLSTEALRFYLPVLQNAGANDSDILYKIGIAYKTKGDYEHALEYLEGSVYHKKEDSEIIAELADCYALINEIRMAKVFFREAFFINPQNVDINNLESLIIQRIIKELKLAGYESPDLEEWIPIYGVLWGILNITRELKAIELGKLKQNIFAMENSIKNDSSDTKILIPKLINKYFWLIDHYINTKEDKVKIEEILEKIKNIDSSIYELYIN